MYITRDFQQVPHQQHVFLLYHINDLRFHWILTSKWFQSSYTALIQVIWTLNYCFEGFTDWQWGQFGEWGVTRQTGDELKLRYKCEYVVTVEKVPQVGEKVQEEKKDAKSKPHTLLSKTCSAWQERRGQNDITKTDIAPLTRTIYSRTGTSEGSSNTGCSWSTPALGKSTDAAVVSKQPAQPPDWDPLVGAPTLILPDWDSRGSVELDHWEFVWKKEEGIFSSLTLFPIGHLLLGQGLIPVFQQFYLEGHTLLTEIQLCACCGYWRKIYSRLQLISLINWLSSRNLWSEAYHWERKLEKKNSKAYALIILPSPSKLNSALKVRSTSYSVTSLKTGLP